MASEAEMTAVAMYDNRVSAAARDAMDLLVVLRRAL